MEWAGALGRAYGLTEVGNGKGEMAGEELGRIGVLGKTESSAERGVGTGEHLSFTLSRAPIW